MTKENSPAYAQEQNMETLYNLVGRITRKLELHQTTFTDHELRLDSHIGRIALLEEHLRDMRANQVSAPMGARDSKQEDNSTVTVRTNGPRISEPMDQRWADVTRFAPNFYAICSIVGKLQKMVNEAHENKAEHGDAAYKKGVRDGWSERNTELVHMLNVSLAPKS